jgi:hypothetical protein
LIFPDNTIQSTAFTGLNEGIVSSSQQILNYNIFATTGSNLFNGDQTISGSIIPAVSGAYDLGSVDNPWRHIYVETGSIFLVKDREIVKVLNANTIVTTTDIESGSVNLASSLPSGTISGSSQLPSGLISGSSQLTTSFPSKTTGTWTVPAGASTQSFTVDWNHSYQMWVIGNIPNGIISWNATVNVTNSNVPIVGSQYGWYYAEGGALVLTSIPEQIVGVNGDISTTSFATTTSNTFEFGITNNSGATQTINYGYIKIS